MTGDRRLIADCTTPREIAGVVECCQRLALAVAGSSVVGRVHPLPRSWRRSGIRCSSRARNGTEVFVGLDSYQAMAADPIFWKALINNFWFALGTIPDLDRAGAC